ncbi:MAG TPA: PUA domain-containing protein [Candidatus Lokiarchaeia archaeon]|nr:PUA domain-containing protein [Candidatus Lokiarchaeia archaeon]
MDVIIKTRAFMNKKMTRLLKEELAKIYGEGIDQYITDNVEEGKLDNGGLVILIKKEPRFFKENEHDDTWIPFVDVARDINMKRVVIDQPAVPYIASGADVMRPGIVDVNDEIQKDELVAIADQKNNIVIAIGKALFDAADIKAMDKGKAIKTIHYAGDKYWALKKKS